MEDGREWRRWGLLVATTWIQALTGTNLDFSAYSTQLKSVLQISQLQLSLLSMASDMGKAFGWCSGVSLLYFPLWLVVFLAAFIGLFGYGLQWLLISGFISLPYVLDHLPLEVTRKTPVLDTALSRIRPGQFQVVPAIENFSENRVHLVNGENLEIDAVILATGYRSNVADWLNKTDFLYNDRLPKTPFPKSWKGKRGLYAAGFTRRGLYGASEDAVKIANDITKVWNEETKPNKRTNP